MLYDYLFEEDPLEGDPGAPPSAPPPGGVSPSPFGVPLGGVNGVGADVGAEPGGFGGAGRPTFNWPDLPGFKPPNWKAPSFEDAQNEPGYRFRLDSGQQALERSAAARGVLRTGGTLKDITEYGQNFGAQEYGNVFNRALQGYDRDYRSAYDQYAPLLAQWNMQAGAERAGGLAAFDREWQQYMFANRDRGGGGAAPPPYDPEPPPPDVSAFDEDDYREYRF